MASTLTKFFHALCLTLTTMLVVAAVSVAAAAQDPTGRPTDPPPKGKKPAVVKPPPVRSEPKAITVILTILTDPPECAVFLNGERRGVTNKDGKFQFEKLPLGHYSIEVQKKDYQSQVRGFDAGADSPTIKFALEPNLDDVIREFDLLLAAGRLAGPDTPNALEVVEKLSAKFPDRPETRQMRGALAAKFSERVVPVVERTISSWRAVTSDEMSLALDSAMNALALRGDDKRIQAEAAYLRGARAFREWQVTSSRSQTGADAGGLASARTELENATKYDESWAAAHYQLGVLLLRIPDPPAAEGALLRAVRIEPRWAVAHAALGSAYYGEGKMKESVDSYRKAIEIDPKYGAAYAGLGLSRAAKGEMKDGIKDIERAKQLDPASALPHWYLGSVYSQSTKSKEIALAIEELTKAIQKNADNLEFQNGSAERLMADLKKRKGK